MPHGTQGGGWREVLLQYVQEDAKEAALRTMVSAEHNLQLGTPPQHINGTVTLNPADDTASVPVAAMQTLTPGPTVTMKWQVATVITGDQIGGDYSFDLTVPNVAPSVGQYSTILPIALNASGQPAGIYTVQASVQTLTTVYAPQSSAAVTAPATVSFTLMP